MANPARAYLATQVETTTQGELLIMLYEAAIKFLKRAKAEIDNKDYAKKGIYISKSMAIIHELSESLNKEKGGEITPKLGSLYQFCTSQLIKANIRLDKKMIDDVIKILDGIRSAYAQIVPEVDGKSSGVVKSAPLPTTPQAPPVMPQATTAPPAAPVAPNQAAPKQVDADQAEATPAKKDASVTPPAAAPQQPAPPKLRSVANAAKFRAANAYSQNR